MAKYDTPDIRNFVLVGHGDSGKTTLAEAMLFKGKMTNRLGEVSDGTTVTDFDPEEKARKISIEAGVAHLSWKGKELNIIDSPGYPDFSGEAVGALSAVETAAICVNPVTGLMVNTRKMWGNAGKAGAARAIIVNKIDMDNVDFDGLLGSIKETFGDTARVAVMPVGTGPSCTGVVSVLEGDSHPDANVKKQAASFREKIVEAAVETDDKLMERYLEGGEITKDELDGALKKAIVQGKVVPILCVAARKDIGVDTALDFIAKYFPGPAEGKQREGTIPGTEDKVAFPSKPDAPLSAQVYKLISDPFVGKLAYFRVYSGTLAADSHVHNARSNKDERIGKIFRLMGKDHQAVDKLIAGDLGAVTKVEDLRISDTLCNADKLIAYAPIEFPKSMTSIAVEPKNRNDDTKIGTAIPKLAESDPTFHWTRDRQTHELVCTGMTQLHLDVTFHKLKSKFGVEVSTKPPKIPYLETITAKGDAQYRHKKQTGGSGQFAEVWMRILPLERGKGFEFENAVVGMSIGRQYMPSIEKGVKSVMERGVIAGYPVVDVKVEVYDGKEHPVDSKDIAFQTAGREAFKLCVQQARPVLLEPIAIVEITVPSEKMGDIMGDLSSRRGRIQGSETAGKYAIIKAQIPLSEIKSYASELRSITGGEGDYSVEFSHYDAVPSMTANTIIEAYKASKAGEKPEE
ncbi:MAG: elongation factor [Planctomycetota bacterium]|nr:MAG: elongation factor [Planctomycetota bacterium]